MRASRVLVYVGIFFLPLLHFKLTHGLNLSDATFAVATILLLLSRRPPPPAPRTPAWYVGAFIFVLAGVVATVNADQKAQSLIVVGNAIYVFFVLQYLLRQQLNTPERLRRGMTAYVLATSVSAFVAILQADFHVLQFTAVPGAIGGNLRAVGLSTQANYAGVSFALGIVFALGLLVELGLRKHWYLAAGLAVMAAALLLTASVSGLASTLVGLFVLFVAQGFKLRTIFTVILAFALVYLLVFSVFDRGSKLDPIARIESTTHTSAGNSGTLSLRIDTIKQAWDEVVQSPIVGHGLDQQSLDLYFDRYIYVYYAPHDMIVLYWYGGGIFMLVGVLIMMGSSFNRLLSGRRQRGRDPDTLRATILAGCVAVAFFSLQGPSFIDRWLWFPFILALCLRDPASTEPEDMPELSATNGRPRRVVGTVSPRRSPETMAERTQAAQP